MPILKVQFGNRWGMRFAADDAKGNASGGLAFALAEPANLGTLIRRHISGWRVDLAHSDAASQVRKVRVIDRNDEGRSRGRGFLRCSATNEMLRKTLIHVVRQAGDETAETYAIQHTNHRFEHSDAHYGRAYNQFGTPKARQ